MARMGIVQTDPLRLERQANLRAVEELLAGAEADEGEVEPVHSSVAEEEPNGRLTPLQPDAVDRAHAYTPRSPRRP